MRKRIKRELVSRADQRVFRWFGHVERMERVPYGQKSVYGGRKCRADKRETEVRLN